MFEIRPDDIETLFARVDATVDELLPHVRDVLGADYLKLVKSKSARNKNVVTTAYASLLDDIIERQDMSRQVNMSASSNNR